MSEIVLWLASASSQNVHIGESTLLWQRQKIDVLLCFTLSSTESGHQLWVPAPLILAESCHSSTNQTGASRTPYFRCTPHVQLSFPLLSVCRYWHIDKNS
jgi:hypothetical protein